MFININLVTKLRTIIGIAVLLALLSPTGASSAYSEQTITQTSSTTAPVSSAAAHYGQLPLSFEPNAGQSDPVVQYQAHAMGGMLYFEDEAVVLSLPKTDPGLLTASQTWSDVRLLFDGVDDAHQVVNAERLPGIVNYFIGNDRSQWLTNLPTYKGIIYKQLYPGIDLRYDGAQSTLKGTYTLTPDADPSRIRWHYEGIASARVDKLTGDLLLALDGRSTLIEKAPSAWQTRNGARVSVTVHYAVMEDGSISFALGDYNPNQPLTIDPQLIYSTYLGGSAFDGAKSVAVDFAGNAYITGVTQSTNFPTENPIYSALNGDTDAFIVKINPSGSALAFATYLGGSAREDEFGSERAGGITVDDSGNVYVTGCTNSADFPTVAPIQGYGGFGNCDAFVTKLSSAGNELIYSTYLGGPGADSANAIAVDDLGSVYIVGDAGKDFPGNPFTNSGHVFVVKIDAAGSAIAFSMFLGGSSFEYATDVAVDSAYNVYTVGNTFSIDFPVLNAAQPTKGGGSSNNHDAFVTKINADGSGLVYSTYLGGSQTDEASGIALDELGNAYITGLTQSALDFPTENAYQASYGGERGDAFVTKLSAAGNAFDYSTFLGGNNDENYFSGHGPYGGIAVDSNYNAYVTGYTCSVNFPTIGSFLNGNVGSCFAFVTRFNEAGDAVFFSTLIGNRSGGSGDASGTDIALDAQGNVYVVGETNATDLLTKNAIQPSYAGLTDAFITKFDPHFYVNVPLVARAALPTATLEIKSPNGSEQWQPGTTQHITWTQCGLTGNVSLELQKGGSPLYQIGTADAAAGTFPWTIPLDQTPGNDYKVRIYQGWTEDISEANFSILTVRKHDLLGSWSTGVSSINSDTGEWSLITASPADQIVAGDMDGDGIDDLIGIFIQSGLWVKYSATGQWQFISSTPTRITVGDFNADGKDDLVGLWGDIVWLRDSASGNWTSISSGATQIAVGDMDGDGKADLIGNWITSGVWVKYSSTDVWENLTLDPATMIAEGDINGDGRADLVGIWSGEVRIRDSASASWTTIVTGIAPTLIAAGDLDGNGKDDLVGNWTITGVWVLYSPTGTWVNLTVYPATWIATGILR